MLKYVLHENGNIIVTPEFERVIPDKSNGKKTKTYVIDRKQYRSIASSAVNLWECRENNVTFFTLTFPFPASESQANECFGKFIENLKLNYGLKSYIATKERGEKGGLLHFHCLFDLPFHDIVRLNKAWCNTFRSIAPYSGCAVQLPRPRDGGAVVRSQQRCVKYICKYISKSVGVVFKQPCYFISRNIISRPTELTAEQVTMLENSCFTKTFSHEYFTCISLFEDEKGKKAAYFPRIDRKITEKFVKTS
jgi:hypothetical protein